MSRLLLSGWPAKALTIIAALMLLSGVVQGAEPAGRVGTLLRSLELGEWHKIHELTPDNPEFFMRQRHGGAAFDTRRGRIVLFGSNTHDEDPPNWDNRVHIFDVDTLSWSHPYPAAPQDSYRLDDEGQPVAGFAEPQPWAMHTFDAVEYDELSDRLIIASHPSHLRPGQVWGGSSQGWDSSSKHPLWAYSIAENRWQKLSNRLVSGFPYAVAYDPQQRQLWVIRPNGYSAFTMTERQWQRLVKGKFLPGWHTAAAIDTDTQTLVTFGNNQRSNQVWQYQLDGDEPPKAMPTPGQRPPGDQSIPLVYHPGIQRVVALVEGAKGDDRTYTWLYATQQDRWIRLQRASLPFRVGMNYNLVYDPGHQVLWLVTRAHEDKNWLAVWVLRLAPTARQ